MMRTLAYFACVLVPVAGTSDDNTQEDAERRLEQTRVELAAATHAIATLRKELHELKALLDETRKQAAVRIQEEHLKLRQLKVANHALEMANRELRVRAAQADVKVEPIAVPGDAAQRAAIPAAFRKRTTLFDAEGTAAFTDVCSFIADVAMGSIVVNHRSLEAAGIDVDTEVPFATGEVRLDDAIRRTMSSLDERLQLHYDGPVLVISVDNTAPQRLATRPVRSDGAPDTDKVVVALERWSPHATELVFIPFSEALEYLQAYTDIPIEVDWAAIADAEVDVAAEVDLKCGPAPLRTLLNLTLFAASDRLSYLVENGTLRIVPANSESAGDDSTRATPN